MAYYKFIAMLFFSSRGKCRDGECVPFCETLGLHSCLCDRGKVLETKYILNHYTQRYLFYNDQEMAVIINFIKKSMHLTE